MAADGKGAACCAGKKDAKACVPGKGKADAQAEAVKEHACTADCKDGKHTYACGEKGHECSTACTHEH